MIILGLVLLVLGWLIHISFLSFIGTVLLVIGLILLVVGNVGGRRHWY